MISLNSYLSEISSAWDDYDGDAIAPLISFEDKHVLNPKLQLEDPADQVERALDEPIDDIVTHHLKVVYAVANGQFVEAYDNQVSMGKNLS